MIFDWALFVDERVQTGCTAEIKNNRNYSRLIGLRPTQMGGKNQKPKTRFLEIFRFLLPDGEKNLRKPKISFLVFVFFDFWRKNLQKYRDIFGDYFIQKPKNKNEIFGFRILCAVWHEEARNTKTKNEKIKIENQDNFVSRFYFFVWPVLNQNQRPHLIFDFWFPSGTRDHKSNRNSYF